ncbi:uncharacterized protein BT62DRAFT_934856 [Guyanagaster necrorhizus]|uniref:Uncharacterized protein n=1 Tax=Guyanagaster necrorhizus TaxID=856835 RepID=A0A9P7VN64_9AGAR|nr:uncharacterized protein BT62DRAFT_934856 [Guyanagaster necrorhizus MCA 3950]KAG7443618.1 hypothetical protein BT62DRAFT_934856 [Guyanagaster necrorhizus MCA 3950]
MDVSIVCVLIFSLSQFHHNQIVPFLSGLSVTSQPSKLPFAGRQLGEAPAASGNADADHATVSRMQTWESRKSTAWSPYLNVDNTGFGLP